MSETLPHGKATYYDPYHLDAVVYPYGEMRDITIHAHVEQHILWSCTYTINGQERTSGGFSNPFEALDFVLTKARGTVHE